jgi:hypothetical protein
MLFSGRAKKIRSDKNLSIDLLAFRRFKGHTARLPLPTSNDLTQNSRFGEYAAMKFLPDGATHRQQMRDRFDFKTRITSALDHAHIHTIYEIGEDEERRSSRCNF